MILKRTVNLVVEGGIHFLMTVGDLLSYLCESRPWCNRVKAISHNAKAFDFQVILRRAILKWVPDIILTGLKIISTKMQHIHVLDSISYLPMPLRKLPEAFGLSPSKAWFPYYYNTKTNLVHVGFLNDIQYFGADKMSEGDRKDFLSWYTEQKDKVFDCRRVLEQYSQDDVTFLRHACQIFRRDLMEIGNIDVLLEAVTIASACNIVPRKKIPQT
jgi:hypothetical protein